MRVLAADLLDLAWSFRGAKCAEVRHATLLAMATWSMVPVEFVMEGLGSFLSHYSMLDESEDCRSLASDIVESIVKVMNTNLIEKARRYSSFYIPLSNIYNDHILIATLKVALLDRLVTATSSSVAFRGFAKASNGRLLFPPSSSPMTFP